MTTRQQPHPTDGVLLFIEFVLGSMLVFTLLVSPILAALIGTADTSPTSTPGGSGEVVENSVFALFVLTLGFQVVQAGFPWIHSRRRGRTLEQDWRFRFSLPRDLGIGAGLAAACLVGAQLASWVAAAVVGLDDTGDASNTDILTDNQDSPWIIGVILLVVVGAPLAEELLFRGFVLRQLERFAGPAVAVVLSSLIFAIPHWQPDANWQETIVLLSALAVVGLVLAIGAVATNRLGPPIIAHLLFNGMGTVFTLVF